MPKRRSKAPEVQADTTGRAGDFSGVTTATGEQVTNLGSFGRGLFGSGLFGNQRTNEPPRLR